MSRKLIVASVGFSMFAWSFCFDQSFAQTDLATEKNPYRSVTMINQMSDAQRAIEQGDWKRACDQYLLCAQQYPDCLDLWVWTYSAATHARKWDIAASSLEHIFELQPEEKNHLAADYGEALFKAQKPDCEKYLRQGLASIDTDKLDGIDHLVLLAERHKKSEMEEFEKWQAETKEKAKVVLDAREKKLAEQKEKDDAEVKRLMQRTKPGEEIQKEMSNRLDEACKNSEGIIIAEYMDYVRSPDIQFFNPPQANFKVDKVLKGPPLARTIPVRFEFHDQLAENVPHDWAFTEDKMPGKGTKLILFLEPAVPKQKQFETYHGSYGRFPADPQHLNPLYKYLHEHQSMPM